MTVVSHDAIRNKFLASVYMNGTLTPEEASAMADFFAGVGGQMIEAMEPVLAAYHTRIEANVRNAVINEIIDDFNSTGIVWTRNSVVARLRSHKIDIRK